MEILKTLPNESVNLCYIDPPFFSNRNYEVIWGDEGEIASFTDRWAGGMEHYIGWLKERIAEIWRTLKNTGVLCVHCDWHADAYIRVYILEKLHGKFVNEVIWCYKKWAAARKRLCCSHDMILIYAKGNEWNYNPQYTERAQSTIRRFGNKKILSGAIDDGGKRIPSITLAEESVGVKLSDWWILSVIAPSAKERIGYPTQKPLALMDRIIKAFSNEGDVVLDAFCGGGTTLVAAAKLKRRFIGIDSSVQAITVSRGRLENTMEGVGIIGNPQKNAQELLFRPTFTVVTHKHDYDSLRNSSPFEFERLIIERFGGVPNIKQRGDSGIDGEKRNGRIFEPIQVKRSENVGRNVIDNFKSAMARFSKNCSRGHIIAFSFSKGAFDEVARLKREENMDISLVSVADIIPLAQKPRITLSYRWISAKRDKKVTFNATGNDVELWQWDWNYDAEKGFVAEVLRDIDGRQTKILSTGTYSIAVRGTDKNGVYAIENLHIIVNGGVKEK